MNLKKQIQKSLKKTIIIFVALATILGTGGFPVLPVQAGVPFIEDVYYLSPTTMVMQFSEEMNPTTIATGDFTLSTEFTNDSETITGVNVISVMGGTNNAAFITASGAKISPSMSDYLKVTGTVNSATGDALTENYPWTPVIPGGDIKISEVQVASATDTKHEFIELYNRSNSNANLSGYKLTYADGTTGAETDLIANFGDVTIGANGGYYLVANAAYTGITPAADLTFPDTIDIPANATIILYDGANPQRVLDLVGFGTAAIRERERAAAPGTGSIERKAVSSSTATTMALGGSDASAGNAYDSDNNLYDFVTQTTTQPQSSASPAEAPQGYGAGGDTGMPMIMHMPLWQAKINTGLTLISQMSDAETPYNVLTTKLYYLPSGGSWASVSGVHIASGYFKFTVPSTAIANTAGFKYYLKASDGTNCRYMSSSPIADDANSGACPGTEPTAIQDAAWQVSGDAGTDWTQAIQGHVYQSDCSTPIVDALVFAEGTGFSDLTDVNGTFDLTGLYAGNYNLVAVSPGYMDQFMMGVESGATWPTICMYSGTGGSGGDIEKPYVIWSAPMDGMMGVPVDISLDAAPIHLAINKQLDSTSVNSTNVLLKYYDHATSQEVAVSGITIGYYEPGDTVYGSWIAGDYLIVLSSETNLDFGKDYIVILTPGVRDTAGNPISGNNPQGGHRIWFNTGYDMGAGGTETFTQGGGAMPPFVIGVIPKPGITDVAINSKIFVAFTEALDSTSLSSSSIQLWKLDSSMNEQSQDTSATVTLEPNKKDLVIVTPSTNLSSSTWYRIKVRGDVKATNGMCLLQGCSTSFAFTSEFQTWSSTNTDSTAPTVTGHSLDMYASGGSVTNVPVNLGSIEIFFSEAIDPTTVNTTNIYLKAGTSQVSGEAEYDPMAKSARFYPSSALVPNTSYTLTVKGGTGGIKDARFPGTVMASDDTYTFTTGGADTTKPTIMFAAADDFRIAITFSEPMNTASPGQSLYSASVLNKNNYAIQYKGPGDLSFNDASAEEIANMMVNYDGMENTAMLEGLDFYAHRGHEFKVTVSNVKDRSGNVIDTTGTPPLNVARGTIQDSANTGGMMGPGGPGMMGPTGTGMDFMEFGMKPSGAWPMNMMEGITSRYFVDLPTSVILQDGDQILLTFPAGFGLSSAAPVPTTESRKNADFNEQGPNTVTFDSTYDSDGVKVEGQTIIVQLDIDGTGSLPSNDFLHFELKGIKNGRAQGTDTINSQGYTITIKSKRPSTGAILENFTTMPFFLVPGGNLSLGGTVTLQGGGAITCTNCVSVYLGSPMTGPMEQLVDITTGSGNYSFTNLAQGEYHVFTQPFMSVSGTDFLGDPMPKSIWLSSNISNQDITLKQAGGADTTQITVRLKGTFKTAGSVDAIDIFAGSGTMMDQGGFAVKPNVTPGPGNNGVCSDFTDANCSFPLYLPTISESTWHVGIGPALPLGPMSMGPPPVTDWWPPAEQNIYIDSGGTVHYPGGGTSVDISITTASEKIIGYVYDGKADGSNDLGTSVDYGKPVKDIDIDAHKREGFGMPAHTRTDASGKFTLSVTTGTFFLGIWAPGMPPVPEKKVLVKDENLLTDGNTDSDVYIDGAIAVTTVSPLVFKLGKGGGYTISGTVSDGTNPVAYAPVWAWNEEKGFDVPGGSDSSGNFTLYVSQGTWKVQAHIPSKGDVPPQTVTIPTTEADGSKRNLLLKPLENAATITGTVSVGGTGQGWAHVWITGTDSQGNFFENGTPTRPDGTYTLSAPPGTGYILHCYIPDYGEQTPITIGTLTANQSLASQNFTVNTANLANLTFVFNNSANLSGKEGFVDVFNTTTKKGQGRHISDVNNVEAYEKLKIVAGDYQVRAHIPGFGEFEPITPAPDSGTHLLTLSAGDVTVTFDLPATGYTVSGVVYVDSDNSGAYNAGDTLVTEGFVWLENWDLGFHGGSGIDNSGNYSIFVPSGTFYLGVDAPGYTGPAPEKIENLTADLPNKNIALVADAYTISGTITGSGPVPYAWVWAEKVDAEHINNPSQGTFSGHKHTEADKDGNYELSVSSGYWWVHAVGPGYKETWQTTAVDASTNPTVNLSLNALASFTAKAPKSKNIKPSEGGTVAVKFGETELELTIPATALGDSTDYSKLFIAEKSGGSTNAKGTLGTKYYDVKAFDSAGSPITGQLNAPIEMAIKYDPTELPTGFSESQLTFGSMNEQGQWEEDMFTLNTDTNEIRVKLDHLSAVATTYPADPDRPSTPGTPSVSAGTSAISLSWTASTDNVAVAGYEVYRNTASTGTFTNISGDCEAGGSFDSSVLVSGTSYNDTTAQSGTTYYYKVTAYDTSGLASADPSAASVGVSLAAAGGPAFLPSAPVVEEEVGIGEEEEVEVEIPILEKPIAEMTVEEIRAKIEEIKEAIAKLQAQLAELLGKVVIEGIPADFVFETSLKQGMTGLEVKYLQIVLNSDSKTRLAESGVGSSGNETEYFGPLTKAAVIKFQEKYLEDILTPWGLTSGTGYVGSTTREKLNELLGQ